MPTLAGEERKDTFLIGLTMAGAISAGAYSAGVFDFLIEALEAWEARKRYLRAQGIPEDKWDVPAHKVLIPVISGASAGGITASLGAVAACETVARYEKSYTMTGAVTATMPRLFCAWVEGPSFISADGSDAFLGTADLAADPAVNSALDTTVLWRIVERSLNNLGA